MTNDCVTITPTITAGAYHANDVIGGVQVLAISARTIGSVRHFQSVTVKDGANQKATLDLLFFDANPAASVLADNGAPTIHATDWPHLIGHYRVMPLDYQTFDGKAIAHIGLPDQYLPMRSAHSTQLWLVITTPDAPTYAAVTDLTLTFGFQS